jgi:glycosyltransferase involved in cell wall biosynthesis
MVRGFFIEKTIIFILMKTLLLNTFAQYGGASLACRRLQNALNKSQLCETRLLTRDLPFEFQNVTAGELGYWGKKRAWLRFVAERMQVRWAVKTKALQFSFSPATWGQSLHQHPCVQEADVLHLHWINFGFLTLKELQKLANLDKKIVWTLHDMWTFTGGCHYAGECTNFLSWCGDCPILKKSKHDDWSARLWHEKQKLFSSLHERIQFVTCSEWLANLARQSGLLKGFPITAIPNPIDTEQFCLLEKTPLRKRFGLPQDKFILLFSAMNVQDKRKGFDYLIEALEYLYHQYPASRSKLALAVVGKSAEKDEKLLFPTYYLGSLATPEAMNEAYNTADAFVLPSLEDNFPNTIMEAMACGLPCVTFATGGLPEMIQHEKTGYLATLKDAQDLAKGIAYLLETTDLPTLSVQARQFVKENYAENIIAQKYFEVYSK